MHSYAPSCRERKANPQKFYRWRYEDDIPKWVTTLKLETIESTVQPSDLLTQDEVDKILAACRHPRNKAFIAVMLESGMRGVPWHRHGSRM